MLNVNIFLPLSEAEGFGINTDLFETNILNLSVVIGVLIYYGRIALGDLITDRKNTILRNLQEADNKLREAEENLAFANKNFETAKLKAEQIRSQGLVLSGQTSKALLDAVEEDIKRLKASNLSSIRFEEEKSINEVVLHCFTDNFTLLYKMYFIMYMFVSFYFINK
uniref:ATP synthase subunit b, chloroplastic n=1 Tax=Monomorphina aenigmatica TaxID=304863 RepID=L0BIP4_MONAE|nr:ATP synthase CF0 B subunit [Monomorphina aenigmatica]AFZ88799.1 ATP synthase CF0 B subunit [Monomorphina aenigmatica]